jgi:hypothetical protein
LIETSHLLPHVAKHNSGDMSWEDRNCDPNTTDCSRDSLRTPHQMTGDCSSQDSLVSGRLGNQCTSSSHSSGEQLLTIESNEADSLQMSIDSGMGMSAADSSCSIFKERHMSVDSSTHDSGVGFSADSPTDIDGSHNVVDSTRDDGKTLSKNSIDCNNGFNCDMYVDSTINTSSVDSSTAVTELVGSSGLPDSSLLGKSSEVVDSTTDSHVLTNISERNPGVSSTNSNCGSVVHRHMSVDSMRDSGIGDGCNSVGSSSGVVTKERHMSVDSHEDHPKSEDDLEALRACWQPKIRESLATRLPGKI